MAKSKAIVTFNGLPVKGSTHRISNSLYPVGENLYVIFNNKQKVSNEVILGDEASITAQNYKNVLEALYNQLGKYIITGPVINLPAWYEPGEHDALIETWNTKENKYDGTAKIVFRAPHTQQTIQDFCYWLCGIGVNEGIPTSLDSNTGFEAWYYTGAYKTFDLRVDGTSLLEWNYNPNPIEQGVQYEYIITITNVKFQAAYVVANGLNLWINKDDKVPVVTIEATDPCVVFAEETPNADLTTVITNENCTPDLTLVLSTFGQGTIPCDDVQLSVETSNLLTAIELPSVVDPNTSNPFLVDIPRGETTKVKGTDQYGQTFEQDFTAPELLEIDNITITRQNEFEQSKITVTNSLSTLTLQYKIDAGDWQTSPIFYVPLDGSYTMYIKDQYGCEINEAFVVDEWIESVPVTVQRKRCGGLHELNKGKFLNLCGKQHTMKIGFVCNYQPNVVKIFKHIQMILNVKYSVKNICVETSLEQKRFIPGNHITYRIREGMHSVPLKNPRDYDDLRGSWAYLEVEIESINNQKVDLFEAVTYLRKSII